MPAARVGFLPRSAALDQRQLRQRIDQRRGSRRVTILHRLKLSVFGRQKRGFQPFPADADP
jgi:hypothetical protein